VYQVRLNSLHGPEWVLLREITGVEEQSVASTSTHDAIQLLDALVVSDHEGALQHGEVAKLTPWDREQLLATVYIRTYGAKIESTIKCRQCGENFDMDFGVDELLASLSPCSHEVLGVSIEADGIYRLGDGISFRLPTGEDECAVIGLTPQEARAVLLERCVQSTTEHEDFSKYSDLIQTTMEALSPLVDIELDAMCPECGHGQSVHFDLQHYLLSAFQGERKRLMQEIHALASNYGWSLSEILGLPRSQRRTLAGLVELDDGGGL
jgi:hypothetical protein